MVTFSALLASGLLASNLMATKIWDLLGIPVDGGLLIYPLIYLVGDMLVEFFGRKQANDVAIIAAFITAFSVLMLFIVIYLPVYPGWEGQEAYATIFGFSLRIEVASITGFIVSQFVNNRVFEKIVQRGDSRYERRAFVSSLVARLFDSALFETIAFLGVLPFSEFLTQAVGAYFEGAAVELILVLTISGPLQRKIHQYISSE